MEEGKRDIRQGKMSSPRLYQGFLIISILYDRFIQTEFEKQASEFKDKQERFPKQMGIFLGVDKWIFALVELEF